MSSIVPPEKWRAQVARALCASRCSIDSEALTNAVEGVLEAKQNYEKLLAARNLRPSEAARDRKSLARQARASASLIRRQLRTSIHLWNASLAFLKSIDPAATIPFTPPEMEAHAAKLGTAIVTYF